MTDVTIYISGSVAPNPIKPVIAAEELGISYKLVHKDFGDGPNGIKSPDFLKINPNGRVPALVDHTNGDYAVWESGAILLYLVERFDKENKLFATDLKGRTDIHAWLYFANSGLTVMTEQTVYWKHFHPVKDIHTSVHERYRSESYRTWDVLEKRLAEQGDYICGHHFTIVDCAVLPLINARDFADLELNQEKYPSLTKYYKTLMERPSVKRAYAKVAEATSA